jgi:hypothetical protein
MKATGSAGGRIAGKRCFYASTGGAGGFHKQRVF